jgi:hypothetical protein
VLVEGLIVASLLSLLLACGVFFHQLYSARLATIRQARIDAWSAALAGCSGGLATALLNTLPIITGLSEADEAGLIDSPDWLTDMGRGVGNPGAVNVQAGPMLGGQGYALRRRMSLACNEYGDQAEGDSNLAAILQAVKDLALSR